MPTKLQSLVNEYDLLQNRLEELAREIETELINQTDDSYEMEEVSDAPNRESE